LSIVGTDAAMFGTPVKKTCPDAIDVTGTCTITVTFNPTGAAPFDAQLKVEGNAVGGPVIISLHGTGT